MDRLTDLVQQLWGKMIQFKLEMNAAKNEYTENLTNLIYLTN